MPGRPVRRRSLVLLAANAPRARIGRRVMRSMRSASAICRRESKRMRVLRSPSELHGQARKEPATLTLVASALRARAGVKEMTPALSKTAPLGRSGSLAKEAPRESVPPARIGLAATRDLRELETR